MVTTTFKALTRISAVMTSRILDNLVVVSAVCTIVLTARMELNPSLECSCTSTHYEDTRFAVKCKRNSSGDWNVDVNQETTTKAPGTGTPFKLYVQHSTVTCQEEVLSAPSPNYERIEGVGYYKFHTNTKSWEEARRTCTREGAHLAIVNSQKEAEVMKTIFERHPKIHNEDWLNNQAFVGVNDIAKEGEYLTIFGQPLSSTGYQRWEEGEPNNEDDGEDCITFGRTGNLNDEPCSIELPFFCEQKL